MKIWFRTLSCPSFFLVVQGGPEVPKWFHGCRNWGAKTRKWLLFRNCSLGQHESTASCGSWVSWRLLGALWAPMAAPGGSWWKFMKTIFLFFKIYIFHSSVLFLTSPINYNPGGPRMRQLNFEESYSGSRRYKFLDTMYHCHFIQWSKLCFQYMMSP